MRLVLASGSPRRREMLAHLGWPFVVQRPDIDETPFPAEPADQYVARLSREKALIVAAEPDDWIIAADTTVALGNDILGKPADAAEAVAMLGQMRDREHTVYTGLTLRIGHSNALMTTVNATRVTMRDYSDADIARYVASGEPYDKAGGYAIQDVLFRPVAKLDGCYANVMGLPLCILSVMLATQGIIPPTAISCRADQHPCVAE
jgi:septum formation protein